MAGRVGRVPVARFSRRRTKRVALTMAVTVVALTACFGTPTTTPTTRAMEAVPTGLERFYTQVPEWTDCEAGADCATASVPLDYSDPSGEAISIALIRHHATGKRIGTLFVNPGGPGGSGVDVVRDSLRYVASNTVVAAFDIVGFDPRGIGASTAVGCVVDADLDD
ncbi:hypothetical protein WJX64_13960 [Leifsonia sp. YIM 134122]|uniref:Alpha/beta hydrolase n=1 Tax=Leifsonia stereocauli TaxID=3134136 RepID=A0ABU9W9X3_9MICO